MQEVIAGIDVVSAVQLDGRAAGAETMPPAATEQFSEPSLYEVDVMGSIARAVETRIQRMPRPGRQSGTEVVTQAKNVLEYLIELGGRLTREETPTGSVGGHLMEEFEMGPTRWLNVRNFLLKHELVVIEKPYPDAKQFNYIALNEEVLPQEAEAARRNKLLKTAQPQAEPKSEPRQESRTDSAQDLELEDDDEEMMLVKEMGADLDAAKGLPPNQRKKIPENWRSKRLLIIIRQHGMYFGEWMTADVFSRLDDTTRLALSIGMLGNRSYSCMNTPEARENFILNMVNKGVFEDEAKKTAKDLQKMVNKAIKAGYLSANGAGPVLTEEGMRHITKIQPGRKQAGWVNSI